MNQTNADMMQQWKSMIQDSRMVIDEHFDLEP